MNKIRKKRVYLLILMLAIILVVLISVFSFKSSGNIQTSVVQAKPVVLGTASIKKIPQTVVAVGNIIAPNTITLSAQQAGVIQVIVVNPGERVQQNQLLLQINNANQEAVYQQQLAQYQQANAEYNRYQNMQKVYPESVSKEILDEKFAAKQVALAQLNAAQVNLAQTEMRAPFAGVVTALQSIQNSNIALDSQAETQLAVGSYVNVGDPVLMLTDPDHLIVQYQIPQQYASMLKLGQSVSISTTAYPGLNFQAVVNYISPIILQTGAVYSVRASVTDHQHRLSPGMTVIATQTINPDRQVLAVPGLSLMPAFNGYNVYIVQDGRVRSIPVTIGERFGPDIAILSGLQKDQKIIIQGQQNVTPGSAVKVESQ